MRGLLSLRAAAFLVLPACLSLTHCGLDTSGALDADLYPEDQGGGAGAPTAGASGSPGQGGAAAGGSTEGPGGGGQAGGGAAGKGGGGAAGSGAVSGKGQGGDEPAGQGGDGQGGAGGDNQGGAGDAGQGGDGQGGAGQAGEGGAGMAGEGGAGMSGSGQAGAGTGGVAGAGMGGKGGAGNGGAGTGGDAQGGAGIGGQGGDAQGGAGTGGTGGDAGQGGDAQGGAGTGGAGMAGAGQGGDAQGGAGTGGAGMAGAGQGGMGGGGSGGGVTCNEDGILDPGEECDAGQVSDPYCLSCVIACGPSGIKDPTTRHCYEFFPTAGDKKNWQDARQACANLPGGRCYLAVPNSDEEIALLHDAVGVSPYQESFWVGATRSGTALALESAFDWLTLEPWRFGPTADWTVNHGAGGPKSPPWGPNQPDNSGNNENCVEYGPGYGPGFNDNRCDVQLNYVCECATPGAPCNHDGFLDSNEECDDGNAVDGDGCDHLCQMECAKPAGANAVAKNPANQHCLALFTTKKNWSDAGSACLSLGAGYHAARIRSVDDFNFMVKVFGLPDATWVDGSDQANEGQFVFSDAAHSAVLFGVGEFPFHPGEPNNSGSKGEDCLLILKYGFGSPPPGLYLNDANCGDGNPYLCEQDPIKVQ
jgi:cysteine-rich repeat protein